MSEVNEAAREGLVEWQRKLDAGEVEKAEQRDHVQKWKDKNTRATAINAFCMQCMGYPDSGLRALIRDCPLYHWRPHQ